MDLKFSWLRIELSGGLLRTRHCSIGFRKTWAAIAFSKRLLVGVIYLIQHILISKYNCVDEICVELLSKFNYIPM
jgi:hypothetical protein